MACKDGHVFDVTEKNILKTFINYTKMTAEDIEKFAEQNGFDSSDVERIFSYIEYEL